MSNPDWQAVLVEAAAIVRSYDTLVTLRQLFYRLVSRQLIRNTRNQYNYLSKVTAEARRYGDFPELFDRTRNIEVNQSFPSVSSALDWTSRIYRRDRTEGQDVSIYLAIEKAGLVNQLSDWFGEPLGIPILPLQGYSSVSFERSVMRHVARRGRKAVLIYAGDHDPSGHDIDRNFNAQTACWDEVIRVALDPDLVETYGLVRQRGKHTDARTQSFFEAFGDAALFDPDGPDRYVIDRGKRYLLPVQVELDALDPNDLRDLFQAAVDEYWDPDAHKAVMEREREEIDRLARLAEDNEDADEE